MRFDPSEMNTREYVRQIIEAVENDRPMMVEVLLEEYGAKAYRQARNNAADTLVEILRT